MARWHLWLLFIIPVVIVLILAALFVFIKRHRGHGYFLSKFSAFTRIRFSHLENRRQTYCPSDENCHCHPQESAAHIEPNLACSHRSPTLYMSFAGAAMVVGGVRTTEWRGSMQALHRDTNDKFDAIFFTDPAQCFYLQDPNYQWQGLAYYRNLVKVYAGLYERVILIGASLGGSMVCMCADLATISIAFNPILDPTLLGIAWRFMGAYCSNRQAQVIRDQVQVTMENIYLNRENHNSVLHIHWSALSRSDQRQARRVVGENRDHKSLQGRSLTSVLDFDLNDPNMCSQTGVHIWFHQSSRHILAMVLKRNDHLIPLLRQHLAGLSTDFKRLSVSSREDAKQLKSSVSLDLPTPTKLVKDPDRNTVHIHLL